MGRHFSLFNSAFTFGLLILLFSFPAAAEPTRLTYPNSINFEGLGKALAYSVNFDRVLSDDLVAGVGFGTAGTNGGPSASLLPIYVNYYFTRDQGSIYLTAGADVVINSSSVSGLPASVSSLTYSSSGALPFFGIGYENRSDSGFLFRATAYGIIGSSLIAWGGLSIGFCF